MVEAKSRTKVKPLLRATRTDALFSGSTLIAAQADVIRFNERADQPDGVDRHSAPAAQLVPADS